MIKNCNWKRFKAEASLCLIGSSLQIHSFQTCFLTFLDCNEFKQEVMQVEAEVILFNNGCVGDYFLTQ